MASARAHQGFVCLVCRGGRYAVLARYKIDQYAAFGSCTVSRTKRKQRKMRQAKRDALIRRRGVVPDCWWPHVRTPDTDYVRYQAIIKNIFKAR